MSQIFLTAKQERRTQIELSLLIFYGDSHRLKMQHDRRNEKALGGRRMPPAVKGVERLGLRWIPGKRVSHIEESELQQIPVMGVQRLHAMVAK
jgi:hypothetical protein